MDKSGVMLYFTITQAHKEENIKLDLYTIPLPTLTDWGLSLPLLPLTFTCHLLKLPSHPTYRSQQPNSCLSNSSLGSRNSSRTTGQGDSGHHSNNSRGSHDPDTTNRSRLPCRSTHQPTHSTP